METDQQQQPTFPFELSILTGDDWVVSLRSDKPINLGDTIIQTIIVQPTREFLQRLVDERELPLTRTTYRLNQLGEVKNENL